MVSFLLGVLLAGCSLLASGELVVDAVIVGDSVATPDDPVQLEVTARNVGERRASWGPGSSTCQLSLLVRVDGGNVRVSGVRRPGSQESACAGGS